jgi:hypothetical protein
MAAWAVELASAHTNAYGSVPFETSKAGQAGYCVVSTARASQTPIARTTIGTARYAVPPSLPPILEPPTGDLDVRSKSASRQQATTMNKQGTPLLLGRNRVELDPRSLRALSWAFEWLLAPWPLLVIAFASLAIAIALALLGEHGLSVFAIFSVVTFGSVGGLSLYARVIMSRG